MRLLNEFRLICFSVSCTFIISIVVTPSLQAEPWLSNRLAQNCAGCHAPSRRNLKLLDRRCTLSCQGCHVNPNGGGMRNQYGIWSSERWLRSHVIKGMGHKKTPAPLKYQKYAKQRSGGNKNIPKKGHPLIVTSNPYPNEKLYDKSDNEWEKVVKNKREFMERLTVDDPLRLERSEKITVSGDFRYIHMLTKGESETKEYSFPMSLDLGIRMRPIPRWISFVVEERLMQGPQDASFEKLFTLPPMTRSAYILVDDLPFNTYAMYGLFKPMFGHDTADHTALIQIYKGFSQRTRYKVISVGTAPNVPFLYVHKIEPEQGSDTRIDGYALNLGARFVTLGLSFMGSYWNTTTSEEDQDLTRTMFSLTGGGYIARTVFNWEYLYVKKEFEEDHYDAGNIYMVEGKLRIWRENYIMTGYTVSDIAVNLKDGSSVEWRLGTKSFPISGVEIEMYTTSQTSEIEESSTSVQTYQIMTHLFF